MCLLLEFRQAYPKEGRNCQRLDVKTAARIP